MRMLPALVVRAWLADVRSEADAGYRASNSMVRATLTQMAKQAQAQAQAHFEAKAQAQAPVEVGFPRELGIRFKCGKRRRASEKLQLRSYLCAVTFQAGVLCVCCGAPRGTMQSSTSTCPFLLFW